MIKLENVVLASPEQMEFIIEGMRNPKNSWEKSDSWNCTTCEEENMNPGFCDDESCYHLGANDKDLMQRLSNAGTEHRKYMRMMPVYVRITAPLYWWKEFDTYKVGTVANSCSTMHKLADKEFTLEDFSTDHLADYSVTEEEFYNFGDGRKKKYTPMDCMTDIVKMLNKWRWIYLNRGKTRRAWWQMIQILPSSYNQTRNVMLNYEVLANIYRQRKNHKLDEWRVFCDWIETLPYAELINGKRTDDK